MTKAQRKLCRCIMKHKKLSVILKKSKLKNHFALFDALYPYRVELSTYRDLGNADVILSNESKAAYEQSMKNALQFHFRLLEALLVSLFTLLIERLLDFLM